jgi:hypothetical protein
MTEGRGRTLIVHGVHKMHDVRARRGLRNCVQDSVLTRSHMDKACIKAQLQIELKANSKPNSKQTKLKLRHARLILTVTTPVPPVTTTKDVTPLKHVGHLVDHHVDEEVAIACHGAIEELNECRAAFVVGPVVIVEHHRELRLIVVVVINPGSTGEPRELGLRQLQHALAVATTGVAQGAAAISDGKDA